VNFERRWHTDPAYRKEAIIATRKELARRFPGTAIGGIDQPDEPLDLLTGTYGACSIAAIFGIPIRFAQDGWPVCEQHYLSTEQIDRLDPPDLAANPFFENLLAQVDWIAEEQGRVEGYINWQGVLNNAWRLRGETLFTDLFDAPERCRHLFDCVCVAMIEAARRLHERQRRSGVETEFITVSNCLVNMVSPEQYREFFLPLDKQMAEAFNCIGIHNCAWNADPYMDDYALIPHLGYIDMGLDSDLARARRMFPNARRALMYTPTDLVNKPWNSIQEDIETIARNYGPCDVVLADIEAGTPDQRVLEFLKTCAKVSSMR
jgi:uroporphyrinogen-III decarboxylase